MATEKKSNFKNIVGTGFPSYVNDQIKKRVEILNTTNRSNNILQYLTNRNVWFRLSSSVNVNGTSDIAKKNILQGGTLKDPKNIRGGFNETYSKGTTDDLGFKPMPGITNVSIGTGGKWQTLMQADIEFICYDLDQLDTMTKLYMSLGYTLFLEWGHSNYFVEDSFIVNPTNIDFFDSKTTKDSILKTATKKRFDTKGNYECLLGTVYNFDWSANNDGSYNCKIQVMGAGGIVESLKINTASNVNFDIFLTEEDTDTDYSSDLECILTTYKKFFRKATEKDIAYRTSQTLSDEVQDKVISQFVPITLGTKAKNSDNEEVTYGAFLNNIFRTSTYNGPQFANNSVTGNENIRKGNAHQVISGIGTANDLTTNDYTGYITGQIINNNNFFQTYITLAHLFTLIQHVGIFSEGKGGTSQKPEVYLDYNPNNTPIKRGFNLQGSVDPSICLVDQIGIESYFEKVINEYKLQRLNNRNNIPPFNGKLFNVLVNLDFIINTLKSLSTSSEDKTVNLMDFITRILDGINVSLGKINSFRPFYDKDSNCIRIIDEHVLPDSKENEIIEIPNFGTKSLVYDYNFNSKISPKLASQIVIAAQASGEDLKNFSEEILSYASLNGGVVDRLAVTKTPSVPPNKKVTPDIKKELLPFKKLYQLFERVYNFNDLSIENISSLTTLYNDIQNRDVKIPTKVLPPFLSSLTSVITGSPSSSPTLVIPIEYSIKIDGISGILPYNIFRVPDDRLPKQYRGRVDFAVFSINHEIENNKWYTILRGQIVIRN